MKNKIFVVPMLTIAIMSMVGCAGNTYSGSTYSASEAKQAQSVRYATVVSVRPVEISKDSGAVNVGSVGGAVLGGFAGNTVGGGSGRLLATAGGALLGGIAGNSVNNAVGKEKGIEIFLKTEAGQEISVVQSADVSFYKGQRVRLVGSGSSVRVTP